MRGGGSFLCLTFHGVLIVKGIFSLLYYHETVFHCSARKYLKGLVCEYFWQKRVD